MMDMTMTDRPPGPGELAARKRDRFLATVLAGCAVVGGALGGVLGVYDTRGSAFVDPGRLTLPPAVAVALAVGLACALIAVPLYMFTKVDEMKVRRNLRSMTGGCLAVLGLYPAWQMLAAGRLMPQPSALGIFAICYVATIGTFAILQLRGRA